jgi:translation initiation factor eIF-2B subunit gamma
MNHNIPQVVILAGGLGDSLYPLTIHHPMSMLPVGNKSVLSHQLDMLEAAGVKSTLVVVNKDAYNAVIELANNRSPGDMRLDVQAVNMSRSAGAAHKLREVAGHIHSDFILMSDNVVGSFDLKELWNLHRVRDSSLTVCLAPEKPGKKKSKSGNVEFFGLDVKSSRLVLVKAVEPSEKVIRISTAVIQRSPNTELRRDLVDLHVYVFSHWVLEYLKRSPIDFEDIAHDVVPHIVRHQFDGSTSLLQPPEGPLELARSLSSSGSYNPEDLVKCHAHILPSADLAFRMSEIQGYMAANMAFAFPPEEPSLPRWFLDSIAPSTSGDSAPIVVGMRRVSVSEDKVDEKRRLRDLLVGNFVDAGNVREIGEKSFIKHSVIGPHCLFGANVKISNCVIHDHVVVEDNVVLSGCILGSRSVIGAGSSLTDCRVAAQESLPPKTSRKDVVIATRT